MSSQELIDLTVGDEVKITVRYLDDGVAIETTRHGKVLAKKGHKILVALANFGSIVEETFNASELDVC